MITASSLCYALTYTCIAETTVPYQGCGVLALGVECPRFDGVDGTSFSITNTGPFKVGDAVFVTGAICFDCPSICQEGAVFHTSSIETCIDIGPPPIGFNECGTLVHVFGSVGCTAFQSESGLYLVENHGGFKVGDPVRVTSSSPPVLCISVCGDIHGCIEDNTIGFCLAEPAVIDTCGTLVMHEQESLACLVFQDDLGNRFLLSDQGAFVEGDRLHVTGDLSFCSPLCGEVLGCVINDAPVGCLGDVNNSGEVNIDDLLAVINSWGVCRDGCPEDLNGDGQVDVDDLLLVINSWT